MVSRISPRKKNGNKRGVEHVNLDTENLLDGAHYCGNASSFFWNAAAVIKSDTSNCTLFFFLKISRLKFAKN